VIKSALCSVLLVVAVSPALASPNGDLELKDTKYRKVVDGHLVRRAETCGTTTTPGPIIADDPTWSTILNEPQVVYINKNGGTYTFSSSSNTNSATNVVQGGNGFPSSGNVTIAPQAVANWDQVMSCIRTSFSPFNITVVEAEPSSGPYVEAILGGDDGAEIGIPGLFGIAATSSFCNLYRNGIAFNFYGTHDSEFGSGTAKYLAPELCNTIVHEVGHVLGLEHEAWRADHMSYDYIQDSGAACTANPYMCKSVVSGAHPCGTYQGQNQGCSCQAGSPGTTSTTVNSYAKLMNYIGPGNTVPDTAAPTLSIITPTDFSSMPRTFDVTVMATDDRAISSVAILVDGTQVDMATTPTSGSNYILSIADADEGAHTLVARAVDTSGNMKETTVDFTVVLAQTGDECTTNEECSGGICANSSGGRFCTETCTEDSCPTDFHCATISSGQMICVPDPAGSDDGDGSDDTTDNTDDADDTNSDDDDNDDDGNNATDDGEGGGCCSTSSGTGALSGGLLALGVGLVVSRRRRRR
jgi:MYXO-CTERM domain-containing protein